MCFSQSSVQISKPHLELQDNLVIISYHIINSTANDRFNIWIEATDADGKNLNAMSLSGDMGDNVTGEGGKQIIWNYQADSISLEDMIYVQVFGEPFIPAKISKNGSEFNELTTGGAVLRSLAFPGWGLSTLNPGKPHWLKSRDQE